MSLINIDEPSVPTLRFGAVDGSSINKKVLGLPKGVGNVGVYNVSVIELLSEFSKIVDIVARFFEEFKFLKNMKLRKQVLNYVKVKKFLLVFCIKQLPILRNAIQTANIKQYLLECINGNVHRLTNAKPHMDAKLSVEINRLTYRINELKPQLSHCMSILGQNADLDLNVAAYTSAYYIALMKNGTLSQCCLVCGKFVAGSQAKATSDPLLSRIYDNPSVASAAGYVYHHDCLRWWENRAAYHVSGTPVGTPAAAPPGSKVDKLLDI